MSRALLQHDEIREFTTIWMDTIRDGHVRAVSNTNKLVRFYRGHHGAENRLYRTRQATVCPPAQSGTVWS